MRLAPGGVDPNANSEFEQDRVPRWLLELPGEIELLRITDRLFLREVRKKVALGEPDIRVRKVSPPRFGESYSAAVRILAQNRLDNARCRDHLAKQWNNRSSVPYH